jgi:hypothetical protein
MRKEAELLKINLQELQDILIDSTSWNPEQKIKAKESIKAAKKYLDTCKEKTVNDIDTLKELCIKLETKYVDTYKAVSTLLSDDSAWSSILKIGKAAESENLSSFYQDLYEDAVKIKPTFDSTFEEVASATNGTFTAANPKRIFRALEKTVMKPANNPTLDRADNVCDVIRGMIIYDNFSDVCQGIETMKKCSDVVVMRTKHRFSCPTRVVNTFFQFRSFFFFF